MDNIYRGVLELPGYLSKEPKSFGLGLTDLELIFMLNCFTEKLKEFEQELLKARTSEEQARIEAKELEIKYDTMRNYFKEAEVDLHR